MDKWFICPVCGQKILKISEKAVASGLFWKCKKCGNVVEIKIEKSL